ncbi:MAG: hypothetical protein IKR51_04765, partial [Oscillospiraceae bacterium]|nr:hypothetical protein [Oscillospiraceae bacterium]
LIDYAEPMAVFASLCGAPYPADFIDLSYNYLLQNHGHDSIGSCGRDIVYEDVMSRYRQSLELSSCVYERAFMDLAGDIDLSSFSRDDAAVVVFNPAPFERSEVTDVRVELPAEWKADSFELLDENGVRAEYQIISTDKSNAQIIQNPNDVANVLHTQQYKIALSVSGVPAMGYKTYKLRPLYNVRGKTPVTMLKKAQTMENEYIRVSFNANGTFDVFDLETGELYKGLGYFKDSGETGNPWEHVVPETNETFTTLNERAKISLLRDGEFETSYRVVINWELPEKRAADEKSRSEHMLPFNIENIVTLRKGARFVEIETSFVNMCEDHYLQVGFPTRINAEYSFAQGQFDVVKREIAKPDYSLYDEIPMTEQPMNSFVDLSDGEHGAALLNTGLKAYEATGDEAGTLFLTLIRAFPLRICVTSDMQDYSDWDKGSQCIGKCSFRYAFMPHKGDWEKGEVWKESERFNLFLTSAQIAPTDHGKNPLTHSFLELRTEALSVSAVKLSEDGSGWVVRLFNPSDSTVTSAVRLNGGIADIKEKQSPLERQAAEFELPAYSGEKWSRVGLVSLEEKDIAELTADEDGFVPFEITGKKILTIKFER